jgi:ligand-binding sensor domain-containing protein
VACLWLAVPQGIAAQKTPAKNVAATAQRPHRLAAPQMPLFRFENFTTQNGLPDNHVYAVLVDGDRIWAGTENGLAVYENHAWKTYTTKDGLAHRAVLSLALDKRTGDVWAGTMGGLSRISAGRIESYTQLNSAFPSRATTCGWPPRQAPAA